MDTRTETRPMVDARIRTLWKILSPIDATERSRCGISYALGGRDSGREVSVALLFVTEPVTSLQLLRFRTQEQMRHFQSDRANYLLEDAARPLRQAGIPTRLHVREGDIVFEILDAAEQLECDEIALPVPHPRWARLFSVDVAREVFRQQRSVPVRWVNSQGVPERI